ncbi:MAG TPA: efflux transporter outer membrane subunit, partial [Terriglobales bacterium]|nr:efflux transporter outer membrane subunit [Terriglobales bacterium]
MRKVKLIFAATLMLAFAGCAVGPKYRRPNSDVPPAYRGQVPELTQTPPASLGDADWKAVFQDEELQKLISTALERNYDVRIAAERVIAAQAQLGITRADQLPNVSVGAGASTIRQPQSKLTPAYQVEAGQVSASASWEIDFWGRYRRASEAARANLAATEWGQRAVRNTIVSSVATAYLQLRELDAELEITQNSLKSRQESLRLTSVLANGGATSMADVRQAEQLVYTASAAIPVLQQQIEQQENFISTLLGQNPGPIARGKSITEQPRLASIPAGLPSQLIDRRPDIRQAEEQLVAANAQIGVAKAALFPSISLTGTAGYQSTALTGLFSSPAGIWN